MLSTRFVLQLGLGEKKRGKDLRWPKHNRPDIGVMRLMYFMKGESGVDAGSKRGGHTREV